MPTLEVASPYPEPPVLTCLLFLMFTLQERVELRDYQF